MIIVLVVLALLTCCAGAADDLCEQGCVTEGVRARSSFAGGLGGGRGGEFGCSEEALAVGGAACVVFPEAFAFDGLVADGAGEFAGARILHVRVLDAPGGALLA